MSNKIIGISHISNISLEHWQEIIDNYFGTNFGKFVKINVEKEQFPENLDVIMFDGGSDVSPIYYGEKKMWYTQSNPIRDCYERIIFYKYRNEKTRFAGICRGSQFLNVCYGGTLYQDLMRQNLNHSQRHIAKVHPTSILKLALATDEIIVNSYHHQASKELGYNLCPTLVAENGVIEGFESIDGDKVRAVQSHPEYNDHNYIYKVEILRYLLD